MGDDVSADPSALHDHASSLVGTGQDFAGNFAGVHGTLTAGADGAGHASAAAALASFTAAAHRAHTAVGEQIVALGNSVHSAANGYQSSDSGSAAVIGAQGG